jgi:hypothetical protein
VSPSSHAALHDFYATRRALPARPVRSRQEEEASAYDRACAYARGDRDARQHAAPGHARLAFPSGVRCRMFARSTSAFEAREPVPRDDDEQVTLLAELTKKVGDEAPQDTST